MRAKNARAVAAMQRKVDRLVGKTVAHVELRAWETDGGKYSEPMYDPLIIFTDGTCVSFLTMEDHATSASYGEEPIIGKRR